MPPLRFVAVGHVTNDRLAQGLLPGGSALYAALAAAELKARARIVTSHGPDFVGGDLLAAVGVAVDAEPAEVTTSFENKYLGSRRLQRLVARAADLTRPVEEADVVFACPVIGEVAPSVLVAPRGAVLGAGLQGWLRSVDERGVVVRRDLDDVERFAPCHVLFASEEDLGERDAALVPRLCEVAEIVFVTRGAAGATMWWRGEPWRVPPHPAKEEDPTGAGDVFAAAFLVALRAGEPPPEAAAIAACAGAVVVEGPGPMPLPGLARIADRLDWYRRYAGPVEKLR